MDEIITAAFVLFAIVGWLLYFNERLRSRDYVPDCMNMFSLQVYDVCVKHSEKVREKSV